MGTYFGVRPIEITVRVRFLKSSVLGKWFERLENRELDNARAPFANYFNFRISVGGNIHGPTTSLTQNPAPHRAAM